MICRVVASALVSSVLLSLCYGVVNGWKNKTKTVRVARKFLRYLQHLYIPIIVAIIIESCCVVSLPLSRCRCLVASSTVEGGASTKVRLPVAYFTTALLC